MNVCIGITVSSIKRLRVGRDIKNYLAPKHEEIPAEKSPLRGYTCVSEGPSRKEMAHAKGVTEKRAFIKWGQVSRKPRRNLAVLGD